MRHQVTTTIGSLKDKDQEWLAAMAEFERELIRERTLAGLTAARTRGRNGGRKFALSKAQVRLAQAAMAHRDTSVSGLCSEPRAVVADAGREVVVDVAGVDARSLQCVALQLQRLGAVCF